MVQKYRSSHLEVFCGKGVLRNFEKFAGKHLRQSLLFNKVAGLRTVTLLKKRFWYRRFPVNFSKFLKAPSIIEHLRWLLLKTPVSHPIFREELVDLQLYYSRTFSQEFSNICVPNILRHVNIITAELGQTKTRKNGMSK